MLYNSRFDITIKKVSRLHSGSHDGISPQEWGIYGPSDAGLQLQLTLLSRKTGGG